MDGACQTGVFFTTLMPDLIEEALIDYLAQHNFEYRKKDNKYQIDFKYEDVRGPDGNMVSSNPEDKLDAVQASEAVLIRMKIMQVKKNIDPVMEAGDVIEQPVEDECEYAVEFIK